MISQVPSGKSGKWNRPSTSVKVNRRSSGTLMTAAITGSWMSPSSISPVRVKVAVSVGGGGS